MLVTIITDICKTARDKSKFSNIVFSAFIIHSLMLSPVTFAEKPDQMEDIVLKPTEAFERPEARIEDIVPKPTRHFEKPEAQMEDIVPKPSSVTALERPEDITKQ
ncbi:uncharacterized protein LOC144421034 isoform X2 [Styela clava]